MHVAVLEWLYEIVERERGNKREKGKRLMRRWGGKKLAKRHGGNSNPLFLFLFLSDSTDLGLRGQAHDRGELGRRDHDGSERKREREKERKNGEREKGRKSFLFPPPSRLEVDFGRNEGA